jgi:predicted amidohydrolase YtcJ
MKVRLSSRTGWVVAAVFGLLAAGCSKPADVLLVNGKVLTVDPQFSIQSAVAVKDGKILAVGGNEIARKYKAPTTIDLRGRVLMPGFMDTHVHVFGRSRRDVELADAASIAELQQIVRAKAQELGAGEWVTGYGWDEAKFAEKRNPTRADLDAAAPDNPVVLTRAGGHSSVGNSKALQIAGITGKTPDPESGLIERDASGEPNGIIRERNDLYTSHVPPATWENVRDNYIAHLKALLPLGITSIIEASGSIDDEPVGQGGIENPGGTATFRRVRQIYDEQGANLPRFAMYISYPGAERLKAFPHHTGFGDDRVRIGPIGESAVDGGFTGPTAWTLADYKGLPGFRGKGRYTDEELQELVDTSAKLGWQMGLHAIGDAAIVQTVNAYSKSIRTVLGPGKDHRWFLDHFTVMPPEETMKTMAADGIRIAQQPNFTYTLEARYEQTLDDERVRHINSVATPAKKHGLFVAFGSDNLPIGPMVGLYAAVTRKGQSGATLGPEESVPMQEAIRMYTANGPYLTFEEKSKGTLEPGKLADMIVLDRDPLTIPPDELLKTQVDLTIIGGKVVYDRAAR